MFRPPINRAAIGIEYATYCPATTKENTAPIALGPANASKPRRRETITENQTACTGAWVLLLTL